MDHRTCPPRTESSAHGDKPFFSRLHAALRALSPARVRDPVTLRRRVSRRLQSAVRGVTFLGLAYLLGSCPLPFGTAPLGLALLAASTSGAGRGDVFSPSVTHPGEGRVTEGRRGTAYPWYVLTGLLLAAVVRPAGGLATAEWVGVYLSCLLLRLAVLFFVDPPLLPGEEIAPGFRGMLAYAGRYLSLCLRSARYNLGFGPFPGASASAEDDYYAGRPRRTAGQPETDGETIGDSSDTSTQEGSRRGRSRAQTTPPPSSPVFCPPTDARLFCEHPFLRILTGAVAAFGVGAVKLVKGGFAVYDLFGALLGLVAVPAAVLLLCPLFSAEGETLLFSPPPDEEESFRGGLTAALRRHPLLPMISAAAVIPAAVLAADSLPVVPDGGWMLLRLSTLLGLVLTLSAARRLGVIPGLTVGLLAGLGDGLSLLLHGQGQLLALVPAFLLTAGVYVPFSLLSHRAGVIAGCTAGLLWCAFLGRSPLILLELPAFLLAAPLVILLDRIWERMPSDADEASLRVSDFALAVSSDARINAQRERLAALSSAFTGLSDALSQLSDKLKKPCPERRRGICADAFRETCAACRSSGKCFAERQAEREALSRELQDALAAQGRCDASTLAEGAGAFCPRLRVLCGGINTRAAALSGSLLRGEQTEVFASDYANVAALLTDALTEDSREYRCNREAADQICDCLTAMGLHVQGVVVCGKRSCRVIVRGRRLEQAAERGSEIAARLGEICGVRLAPPTFEVCEGYSVMIFTSELMLDARFAGSTAPAGTGEDDPLPPPLTDATPAGGYLPPDVCGDHVAIFRTQKACLYALISDGMGSGEAASETSALCALFLERMLAAGSRVEISLRMLNSVIRARGGGMGDECSATVDLLELDLTNGHAVFAKNGASPTYVVRGGRVYRLRSRTLPIGILRDAPPRLLRFRMHPGDVVVMVSDGVTLGNDECPWLIDLLSDPLPEDMDALRLDILRRAIASGSPDDLSAIAIRILENGV